MKKSGFKFFLMNIYNNNWRLTRVHYLFILLFLLYLVAEACRKVDQQRDRPSINLANQFFEIPANTNPLIRSIADKMKRQNDDVKYVNDIVKKIGIPIWNKSMIVSSSGVDNGRSNIINSDSIDYSYIPFGLDSVIKATLIVRTTPADTLFRLLNDWEYKLGGFDTSNGEQWNANDVFHLFAKFEKEVYGHKALKILDRRLGPISDTMVPLFATLKDEEVQPAKNESASLLISVTLCDYIDYCYAPPGEAMCNGGICTEDCDQYLYTGTECTTFWVEDGWSGGSPPYIPWGGSGNGPWYSTICTMPGAYCNELGWAAFDANNFQDNYINMGYRHFETWELNSADEIRIENWRNGNNIDTVGLDSCIRKILDKLIGGQNLIGRMFAKLDNARPKKTDVERFKIKVMLVDNLPSDIYGKAGYGELSGGYFIDTVYLNRNVIDTATEMGVASIIIHEFIHAYLQGMITRYWYSLNTNGWRYDSIFSTYVDSLMANHTRLQLANWITDTSINGKQRQHNFMADKLVDRIAAALAWVDDNRNTPEYYWLIAWTGLQRSKTMNKFWPNYPGWPPSNPAPNNDSLYGLKYAFTTARIDSFVRWNTREMLDTSKAKGRKRVPGGCYPGGGGVIPD